MALTFSGGGPYSSLEKALDTKSNIPMPRDVDDDVVDARGVTPNAATLLLGRINNIQKHDANAMLASADIRWEDTIFS